MQTELAVSFNFFYKEIVRCNMSVNEELYELQTSFDLPIYRITIEQRFSKIAEIRINYETQFGNQVSLFTWVEIDRRLANTTKIQYLNIHIQERSEKKLYFFDNLSEENMKFLKNWVKGEFKRFSNIVTDTYFRTEL